MDPRDRAASTPNWWENLDERKMTLTMKITLEDEDGDEIEHDVELPFKFVVCDLCDGKGSHVNPSIDAHGITGEEMDQLGPEFQEDYLSGVYDISCNQCNGKRVMPEIDEDRCNDDQKKLIRLREEQAASMADFLAECEAERRMGA